MKILINEKRSLEFYFLMIALGSIQAYRYNCINLNILESLFYRMDMGICLCIFRKALMGYSRLFKRTFFTYIWFWSYSSITFYINSREQSYISICYRNDRSNHTRIYNWSSDGKNISC